MEDDRLELEEPTETIPVELESTEEVSNLELRKRIKEIISMPNYVRDSIISTVSKVDDITFMATSHRLVYRTYKSVLNEA